MRIPHIDPYRIEKSDKGSSKEVKVDIQPEAYVDDLGMFEDKKEYIKWIMRMKKYFRDSRENEDLIHFLKYKCGMDCCGVHPNQSVYQGFRIELHHTPFCLEDIVNIVTNKRLTRHESVKMSDIATELAKIHWLGLVGLYPLCTLCHSIVHTTSPISEDLFIPISKVYGDPERFVDIYGEYMSESMQNKWNNILQLNKSYDLITEHLPIELIKEYVYISVDDKTEAISTNKLITFVNDLSSGSIPKLSA